MYTLNGRKLKTIKPATKREVFMLSGVEISRTEANRLATETIQPSSLNDVMKVVVFRDLGTLENPSQTINGPMWREYRPI